METADIVKTLVCPIWGIASWSAKRTANNKKGNLYGDAPPSAPPPPGAAATILVLVCCIFVPAILTLCGIVKAFMCGSNPTSLGGSGFIWGLLGIFVPLPAIIYLFAGHCKTALPMEYVQDPGFRGDA